MAGSVLTFLLHVRFLVRSRTTLIVLNIRLSQVVRLRKYFDLDFGERCGFRRGTIHLRRIHVGLLILAHLCLPISRSCL